MKTTEVSIELIGKRVKGIYTIEVTGTVSGVFENEDVKGVEIELDRPVLWGDHAYSKYRSLSRKVDEFGNLEYTELI